MNALKSAKRSRIRLDVWEGADSNECLEERVALSYTAGRLGSAVSPIGFRANPWWGSRVMSPENFLCLCLQNRKKLAHGKNEM